VSTKATNTSLSEGLEILNDMDKKRAMPIVKSIYEMLATGKEIHWGKLCIKPLKKSDE
jgi:hypothetical protein